MLPAEGDNDRLEINRANQNWQVEATPAVGQKIQPKLHRWAVAVTGNQPKIARLINNRRQLLAEWRLSGHIIVTPKPSDKYPTVDQGFYGEHGLLMVEPATEKRVLGVAMKRIANKKA